MKRGIYNTNVKKVLPDYGAENRQDAFIWSNNITINTEEVLRKVLLRRHRSPVIYHYYDGDTSIYHNRPTMLWKFPVSNSYYVGADPKLYTTTSAIWKNTTTDQQCNE